MKRTSNGRWPPNIKSRIADYSFSFEKFIQNSDGKPGVNHEYGPAQPSLFSKPFHSSLATKNHNTADSFLPRGTSPIKEGEALGQHASESIPTRRGIKSPQAHKTKVKAVELCILPHTLHPHNKLAVHILWQNSVTTNQVEGSWALLLDLQ